MISRSVITISLVVSLLFALLLNACNPKSAQTNSGTDTTQANGPVSATPLPSIFLDSLSITSADFIAKLDTTKKQNIIFNYFLADTTITLHGWVLKKGKSGSGTAQSDTGTFNPTYDLKLIPAGKSKITIGPNTYLSNQVILGKTEKKILKAIKDKNAIIYFSPKKDATGRISYIIRIKFIGISDTPFAPENFETNPAPPHQAFD